MISHRRMRERRRVDGLRRGGASGRGDVDQDAGPSTRLEVVQSDAVRAGSQADRAAHEPIEAVRACRVLAGKARVGLRVEGEGEYQGEGSELKIMVGVGVGVGVGVRVRVNGGVRVMPGSGPGSE